MCKGERWVGVGEGGGGRERVRERERERERERREISQLPPTHSYILLLTLS